jgi:hypothetical protein
MGEGDRGDIPVRMAVIESEQRHAKERDEEDRKLLRSIDTSLTTLVGQVGTMTTALAAGEMRFQKHDEQIIALQEWRASHTAAKNVLAGLWGALVTALGAAGIYFATFFHPGAK